MSDAADSMPSTRDLLRRWHDGDREALDEVIHRHLPWIHRYVHDRLRGPLRAQAETLDLVQDSVLDVLRYGPRFELADEDAFRGLLARIVENNLKDRQKWLRRACRDAGREAGGCTDSVLMLDPPATQGSTPSQRASADESAEWIRLAVELLDPADREIILLREWDELSFAAISERLGCAENAARMRFQRALPKLAAKVAELRAGRVAALLGG